MKRVFCLGNGESRKDVNLSALKPHGKIYGCNALYRDFTPDVLVAVVDVWDRIDRGLLTDHPKFFACLLVDSETLICHKCHRHFC